MRFAAQLALEFFGLALGSGAGGAAYPPSPDLKLNDPVGGIPLLIDGHGVMGSKVGT
jgi:hypothetical protein